MAGWVRQLPSKKWAATIRSPAGLRITETFPLQSLAQAWADDQVASVRRGDWIDPREGEATVGALYERFDGARRLEKASRKRDASHWRVHVEPYWGRWKVGGILRPDVTKWVTTMEANKVGAATIEGAVGVLRSLLDLAVDARIIRVNPASGVKTPRRPAHHDRVLTFAEEDLLLSAFQTRFGDRVDGRLFVELLLDTGLRWEEAAAIDREHVDLRRALIQIGPVMEKDGTVRPYPKSPAGVRPVAVGDELWPRFRAHVLTVPPKALVFTALEGGPLRYDNWRDRIWLPALTVVTQRGPRRKILATEPLLADPQPTPHDLRHTFGTRLGEAGVPPHEIMELMGHARLGSVQRYLHASEDRFERARAARGLARQAQEAGDRARQGRMSHP
jgi:integrase